MSEVLEVSLDTLAGGAAVERFNYELRRALENIGDFNTRADQVRSVTLTLKMKPSDDRSFINADIQVSSKLAPIRPEPTSIYLTQSDGKIRATEYNPKQEKFSFQDTIKQE